jgi:peptidoglycan/LPS O-acetylase OafA/YrhL
LPTVFNVLCNLTIWPVGFWPYFPTLATFQLVPPAWSLTIELTFYLLLPAMLARAWVVQIITALALVAFCLATQGIIQSELYSYRMLPAPLLYIVLGHALYARKSRLLAIIYAVLVVDLAWVIVAHKLGMGFNPGIFLGVFVGTALVAWSARIRSWRFDDLFGRMSYGCYLGHWPLLTVVHPHAEHAWMMVPFAMASAGLGWLSYKLVDARLIKRRRRLAPLMSQSVNASVVHEFGLAAAARNEANSVS